MMALMPGQTIIANQIQIGEKEEEDNVSTCSSSNSSAGNNDNNTWESNPSVSWPEDCLAMMDMRRDRAKMVFAKKPMPAAAKPMPAAA